MGKVTINQKEYDVPTITFAHVSAIDEMGGSNFAVLMAYGKKLAALTRFVALIVGCDLDRANFLIEQHVLGGGSLNELVDVMDKAVSDSHFLRKAMEQADMETQEETQEETPTAKTQNKAKVEK